MNRRSLLTLSLLALPARLFGQDSPRRTPRARQVSDDDPGPPVTTRQGERLAEPGTMSRPPVTLVLPRGRPRTSPTRRASPGRATQSPNTPPWTRRPPVRRPAIIDWIFRRTTPAPLATATRSPCSAPAGPNSEPTTRRRSLTRSRKSSRGSPTLRTTSSTCGSGSSPRPTPDGDTPSTSVWSRSAPALKASRSGTPATPTPRW